MRSHRQCTKNILYHDASGNLVISTPVFNNDEQDWAEEAIVVRAIARLREVGHLPEDTVYKIVDANEIPTDWEYRDAWKLGEDGKIAHDFAKAKAIKINQLRDERKHRLDKVDHAIKVAEDRNQDTRALRTHRQALRDVTEPVKILDVTHINDLKDLTFEHIINRLK